MRGSATTCATRFTPARSVGIQTCSRASNIVCGAFGRRELLLSVPSAGLVSSQVHPAGAAPEAVSAFDFTVQQYGADFGMSAYKGQVLVVVNVASE